MINLLSYASEYASAVKTNPMLAGFAVYGMGVLTYLARSLPKKLWDFIATASTTSLTLDNSGNFGNEAHFNNFLTWFMKNSSSKHSRSLSSAASYDWSTGDQTAITGPGYGWHFFMKGRRLFWFHKGALASEGSEKQKQEIKIRTLGRSHTPLLALIEEFKEKKKEDQISIRTYFDKDWKQLCYVLKRPWTSICIKKSVKVKLEKSIQQFIDNPTWYHDKGLSHKLTVLLHGKPGTGKSSIVKALASHYSRNIHVLDLSTVSNDGLQAAVACIPGRSILLIEDIDAATSVVTSRDVDQEHSMVSMLSAGRLTLSGILNTLDGVIPLNDVIIFITTNHLEKLDPALIRKSRVDHLIEIEAMGNEEIHDYISVMYPGEAYDKSIVFDPMIGCDVQAAFMETPTSLSGFIELMPAVYKS